MELYLVKVEFDILAEDEAEAREKAEYMLSPIRGASIQIEPAD